MKLSWHPTNALNRGKYLNFELYLSSAPMPSVVKFDQALAQSLQVLLLSRKSNEYRKGMISGARYVPALKY